MVNTTSQNMENTSRITHALATLKSEFVELRNQDIQLMKQMIDINETISNLKRRQPSKNRKTSFSIEQTPLILEENVYISRKGSDCEYLSNSEEINSSYEDLSTCSEGSFDSSFSSGCSINYEDILNKNIKLWKHSKSISSESLTSLY